MVLKFKSEVIKKEGSGQDGVNGHGMEGKGRIRNNNSEAGGGNSGAENTEMIEGIIT